MAQLLTVRLTRGDAQPWGFRLQGGKDFGTPLLIQKVNSGSLADQVGLIAGDAVIKINGTEVFDLRHKDAQDVVVRAGNNVEIAVQRGGSTWKPNVTPTGHLPSPNQYGGLAHVTKTSLAHKTPDGRPISAIGTGYNNAARPFNSPTGAPVKSIVNKQYNTPVGIYSDETIAETLSAQAEVLAGGVLGVNFKKNEKMYNSANSEVYKMLQEQANDPEEPAQQETHIVTPQPTTRPLPQVHVQPAPSASVTKHVTAPIDRPLAPQSNGLPPGQNICAECERLIVGVFVRIKDKNLHAECFKCATCGSSLKNQGYYNVNNKLYCDVHARQAAIQKPPQGTQGYSPVPIKPDSKIGANIIQAALQSKSSNQFNGTSQNNNNSYIVTPSHSRTNSSDSTRTNSSLSNKNSLINSNRTTPSQSGKSSPILNGIKSEIIINLTDRLDDSKYSLDDLGLDENDNRKYNLCFQTLNGGTIRSVKPPGKGYDTHYKINNPYAAPKPYNYSQPPQAGPKSPSSYPPAAPSWSQPQGNQVNQGKFNTFGPSYQEICCAQEICNVMSNNINVQTSDDKRDTQSSLNWPPTTKSSIVNDSGRYTPTASPLYIQPPETVHYEARVHTQTSSSKQQQQKLQHHEQHTNTNNLLKSNIDLESSSESYTSTTVSSEEQQKIYQTSLTHANQMNNYNDVDLSENDLSELQHYKMSLCSSEVNEIVGRRSVQECAESVSDTINTQLLIDAVKESSPRPASPIPKPYKRVEFANEKPMPKEEQVMTEGSQTIDGSLQNNDDEETELIDLRSEELDDECLAEKYNIPETKAISPTNIPNPIPKKYQSEMLKALKAESTQSWRPVSTPTIEIEDYENYKETHETETKQAMTVKSEKCMTAMTQTVSKQSEEKSVHEEVCIKKEASTKDQVTSVIEVVKEPRVELPIEAPKSGFMTSLLTTAPSQPLEFVPKPSNDPVPLPEVTIPYLPPPISMTPIIREDDCRSKTPLLQALIVAPNEPYSAFGKEVSSQLDDLPRPNPNEKTTLAGALTVAPDRSYTPFTPCPEQMYTCCVSEPVYTETNSIEQDTTICMSEAKKSSAFANVNGFSATSTFKPRVEALNWFNSTPLPYCANKSDAIWSSSKTCKTAESASTNVCSESLNLESEVCEPICAPICAKPIQRQPPHEHPTTLSYQKKPYYSGLHKPDTIPVYQKDLMKLPSQTPVRPPESPQLKENVPIAFLDTPEFASNLHKPIAISASSQSSQTSSTSQIETLSYVENKSVSFAENRTGTITMAFQSLDQYDDQQHQKSFIPTNRPITPSLINKPAPTIPYYQQNLCPIDCKPTESHVFDPHSRSPSPHPERAKSPAPGPPPNPLRAVCPRIKDKPVTKMNKQLETEIKTQVAEKAEQKTYSLVGFKNMPVQEKQSLPLTNVQSAIKPITTYTAATSQFADVKNASNYNIEKHASAAKFTEIPKTVQQAKIGDTNIQTTVQGSAMAQQHKSEKQSSQTTNVGNKQIQRRTRVVEEFERSRSEKQMEIVKTQGDMSRRVTFEQNACGGAAAAAIANSNDISKKEGFVAKLARRLSQDTSDLQKFPITVDLSRPMTHFPSISSSPKVRHEQNLPRLDGFSLPETPCSINQLSSNTKAQSATSYKSQQKHEDQMNTLTQHHKQELQQKSIASSTTTTAAYTNANQQLLATYKKFETAPTTAMNVNNTKYPQSITKSSYPPIPVSSKIQAPASTISQKLTQQKITPNAVVSDSSPASAGSNSTKGGVFGATTAPKRGRGTLNKAVGPGARVPLCGCCNTQIRGPFITALGRIWCPDHFVCSTSNCRRQLQDIGFVEEKNQLYCEFCFEKYLAPSCSKCNSKIKGDCLNAIGKHYHPECFTCTYCGKLFGNSAFFLEEGDAYCEADWNELFTTKCFACGFPVEAGDRWVEALNNNYHSQCFNCSMCKKNLEGQSFVAKGGRPFCKNHAR